jgi:hypothetical protein
MIYNLKRWEPSSISKKKIKKKADTLALTPNSRIAIPLDSDGGKIKI